MVVWNKARKGNKLKRGFTIELIEMVSSSQYGLEMAYALFSNIFFQRNERIAADLEKRTGNNGILSFKR